MTVVCLVLRGLCGLLGHIPKELSFMWHREALFVTSEVNALLAPILVLSMETETPLEKAPPSVTYKS